MALGSPGEGPTIAGPSGEGVNMGIRTRIGQLGGPREPGEDRNPWRGLGCGMVHLIAASLLWAFSFGLIKGQLAGIDPVYGHRTRSMRGVKDLVSCIPRVIVCHDVGFANA